LQMGLPPPGKLILINNLWQTQTDRFLEKVH
jgi:hypothetical protein